MVPDPGVTGRRSSPSTEVSSFIMKRGGPSAAPAPIMLPWPPVSDAPIPSITRTPGSRRTSASFTTGDRIAPPDNRIFSAERSKRDGSVSRASTSGRANASPTITRKLTSSTTISRQKRAGSSRRSGEETKRQQPNTVAQAATSPQKRKKEDYGQNHMLAD